MKHSVPFESSPYELEGSQCVFMWHKKIRSVWHLYFKFRKVNVTKGTFVKNARTSLKRDLLQNYVDVHHNDEDGCYVLEVVTHNFISLPVVMGYILTHAFLSVGHQMRYQKLKLLFNTQYVKECSENDSIVAVIDPAINIFIRYWWDPKYPMYQAQNET